jgi:hypothetical protein
MNCLECATTVPMTSMAQTAVGCCAYCGAGTCLLHVRFVPVVPRPVGLVPRLPNSRRRLMCTTCDPRGETDGLTVSMLTDAEDRSDRADRRGLAAFMSALAARESRPRRRATP